ncbi:MAG: hypothetical protein R3B54_02335 [Bdellovibrionota bacterium]
MTYLDDIESYFKFASPFFMVETEVNLRAKLTKEYHKLEKSLVFAGRAPGFGEGVSEGLARDLERYIREYGPHELCGTVLQVLTRYADFQEKGGIAQTNLREAIARCGLLLGKPYAVEGGGYQEINREDFLKDARADLKAWFYCRHSVRDFSDSPVSDEPHRFGSWNGQTITVRLQSPTLVFARFKKSPIHPGRSGFSER